MTLWRACPGGKGRQRYRVFGVYKGIFNGELGHSVVYNSSRQRYYSCNNGPGPAAQSPARAPWRTSAPSPPQRPSSHPSRRCCPYAQQRPSRRCACYATCCPALGQQCCRTASPPSAPADVQLAMISALSGPICGSGRVIISTRAGKPNPNAVRIAWW